jgi:hypothetical protein
LFEKLDSLVNTQPLRSNARTGLGTVLSHIAELTPRPNEQMNGAFDRLYFHHIRKTAGTSIVFAFFALSGVDPHKIERQLFRFAFARVGGVRYVEANAQLIQDGRYFFAVSHFPSYVSNPPTEGTFAFTVLRDPVKRIASLYRYLRSADSDKGFTFRAPARERSLASGSFGAFLDGLPKEDLLRQLYMFSPTGSVSETVDTLGRMQLVMHTESLADGVELLRQKTGVRLNVGRERATAASIEIPESELSQARLLLEPEYEMLRQLNPAT